MGARTDRNAEKNIDVSSRGTSMRGTHQGQNKREHVVGTNGQRR